MANPTGLHTSEQTGEWMDEAQTATEKDGCLTDVAEESVHDFKHEEEGPAMFALTTKMRAITLVAVIYTLSCITIQSVAQTGYLYLMMIDSTISPTIFFYAYGAAKISQFIALIFVSLFTNRTHRYRLPLILGRVFSLIGVCLYLALGIVDSNWRITAYITAFVLIGFGDGTTVLCRGYAPKYSSIRNRPVALGIMTAAGLAAILFAPAVNLSFASLKESALSHWGGITWNIFTLPLLILIALNLTAIVLSAFVEEPTYLQSTKQESSNLSRFSTLRLLLSEESKAVDPALWRLSLLLKAVTAGSFFAVLTGFSQHADATFNLTKEANVELLSKGQIGAAIVSTLVASAFIFLRLGSTKWFHPTHTFVYSLLAFAAFCLLTLNWPWAERIVVRDASSPTGCDPLKFDWCHEMRQIDHMTWIVAGGVLMGVSIPLALIAQDTMFSRVIESSTRRDLHQGVYAAIECLINTIVPAISGPAYARLGPHYFYIIIGSIQLAILARFILSMRKYREL